MSENDVDLTKKAAPSTDDVEGAASRQESPAESASAAPEPEKTTPATESVPDPEPGAGRSFTRRLPSIGRKGKLAALVAAGLLLVTSLASNVFLYQRDDSKADLLAAHESAREAACRYAPVLVTYDAKDLDTYFTSVLDGATGDWRKQFDSTSKDLREVLVQGQVVAKADDVQCAIRTGDENSAEAIVVIGQTITSLGTKGQPAPGQLSMILWLERAGDKWLVNKVNSPLAQLPQS